MNTVTRQPRSPLSPVASLLNEERTELFPRRFGRAATGYGEWSVQGGQRSVETGSVGHALAVLNSGKIEQQAFGLIRCFYVEL